MNDDLENGRAQQGQAFVYAQIERGREEGGGLTTHRTPHTPVDGLI